MDVFHDPIDNRRCASSKEAVWNQRLGVRVGPPAFLDEIQY